MGVQKLECWFHQSVASFSVQWSFRVVLEYVRLRSCDNLLILIPWCNWPRIFFIFHVALLPWAQLICEWLVSSGYGLIFFLMMQQQLDVSWMSLESNSCRSCLHLLVKIYLLELSQLMLAVSRVGIKIEKLSTIVISLQWTMCWSYRDLILEMLYMLISRSEVFWFSLEIFDTC